MNVKDASQSVLLKLPLLFYFSLTPTELESDSHFQLLAAVIVIVERELRVTVVSKAASLIKAGEAFEGFTLISV